MNKKLTLKTIIILQLILFAIACKSECINEGENDNFQLLKEDKYWNEISMLNTSPGDYIADSIIIEGNDTINDIVYSRIVSYRKIVVHNSVQLDTTTNYLHEDEKGNIYNMDGLLYDFSMSPGDTIWNDLKYGSWIVTDTEVVNSKRKLTLKSRCSNDTMYWIEGIGSSLGLIYDGTCYLDGSVTTESGNLIFLTNESIGTPHRKLIKVVESGNIIFP